ncbi:ABC transporter permease [Stenotrophomonas maltophilia]|uniref:ABC transporter permease n=1 Tax=Stenotrophomonas maltophilia TaxID=40324 RepID=UPI0015E0176F|nr:ABC transporter permease [Stenotrophomonas maltophilia]MBA0282742.1 ABC transporter permease [Stenotrophomonas maltophilia]MBA0345921.1 ABC transporter permease [Stenotrophomonas maltophilia]MBA0359061.1 ABC transporter permease [Stenotrophomonas maltophilia]MBA0521149.1 ABC transporter permease [Stenotrophomonas maltophilia]
MSYNAHHSPGGHMQWGLLAPATVILGGAGLLFLAGAQEIGQNLGYGWQAGVSAAGGAAVLLLLALLYVLNWRAARVRAARASGLLVSPRKGGFGKGALVGLLFVVALQLASVAVGLFYPGLGEGERNFFTFVPPMALMALLPVALIAGGVLGNLWRSTSL